MRMKRQEIRNEKQEARQEKRNKKGEPREDKEKRKGVQDLTPRPDDDEAFCRIPL